MSCRLWTAVDAFAWENMKTTPVVVVAALLATACGPAAAPYRPALVESGHGWWCTVDTTGVVSHCARREASCNDRGDWLQSRSHAALAFEACRPQPTAHCYAQDVSAGGRRYLADQCQADERSCELARSRMIQSGYHLTACGALD